MKHLLRLLLFSLIIFGSCESSSHLTSSWKAEEVQPKKYKKIVVLGLIREADRTIREKMEQHLVDDLASLGYTAVCSCNEYSPRFFDGLTEEQALEKLKDSGVDAVLTVTLLDKQKEKQYVPGKMVYSPYSIYHNRFFGYYRTMYQRIYTEGYYVTNTRYFWESNFYELSTNKLLYSAQSQSFEPGSTESLSHEYGRMIVKDMVKNNIITNQSGGGKAF